MMVTEEEAKTKWCPHARVADPAENTYNRDANDRGHTFTGWMCIGSACMSWRRASASLLPTPDDNKGYCGLAGRPT